MSLLPRYILGALLLPLLVECEQIGTIFLGKTMDPQVARDAAAGDMWYRYNIQEAPGFCLETRHPIVWRDPALNLGCWQGISASEPGRVMMEARNHILIIYPGYVWDGMTIGCTTPADLFSTLLHDSLYHALAGGATFERKQADQAFLRYRKADRRPNVRLDYAAIRLFGWWSSRPHGSATMMVHPVAPHTPTAHPLPQQLLEPVLQNLQ